MLYSSSRSGGTMMIEVSSTCGVQLEAVFWELPRLCFVGWVHMCSLDFLRALAHPRSAVSLAMNPTQAYRQDRNEHRTLFPEKSQRTPHNQNISQCQLLSHRVEGTSAIAASSSRKDEIESHCSGFSPSTWMEAMTARRLVSCILVYSYYFVRCLAPGQSCGRAPERGAGDRWSCTAVQTLHRHPVDVGRWEEGRRWVRCPRLDPIYYVYLLIIFYVTLI